MIEPISSAFQLRKRPLFWNSASLTIVVRSLAEGAPCIDEAALNQRSCRPARRARPLRRRHPEEQEFGFGADVLLLCVSAALAHTGRVIQEEEHGSGSYSSGPMMPMPPPADKTLRASSVQIVQD